MVRFRLRFLLQEIDLREGETLLGRGSDCQVTIEDPLVSRRHAAIRVQGGHASVVDLGSRNGVTLNGSLLQGSRELAHGDRIRIGTQEMVFTVAQQEARSSARSTGFMCHCAECGHPYPEELRECPTCGSERRAGEDTLSGAGAKGRSWSLELLVEVLERACSLERWDDGERVLQRVRANLEEQVAAGGPVDRAQVDRVAVAAARVAAATGRPSWAGWVLALHRALGLVPEVEVSRQLTGLPPEAKIAVQPHAGALVERVATAGGPPPGYELAFERLKALAAD
ncbi:MAG: FHA domain-containing protein [Polyangiaceae bacterium]|nr:FHA domain-containing protein [Polyangiaceae bacterium]